MRDLAIALSGAMAQEQRLAIVANNLANVNTAGFKKDGMIFESLLPTIDTAKIGQTVSSDVPLASPPQTPLGDKWYVAVSGMYTDFSQGDLRETMNPLDMAIQGPGFFAIQTDQGERYTRAGSFVLSAEGDLCTPSGAKVLDSGGGPIRLDSARFAVSSDGTILQDGQVKARLRLVQFDDPRALDKVGKNEFAVAQSGAAPRDTVPEDNATVRQHVLEYSNVNTIDEMVRMIETERAYQTAQRAIQTIDGATGVAIGGVLNG